MGPSRDGVPAEIETGSDDDRENSHGGTGTGRDKNRQHRRIWGETEKTAGI